MTKQTKIKHYTKRDYAAFAYLAPWIIGMLILQLYPFLSSLVYSFCNYKITGTPKFCGLQNYIQLFTMDNEFWNSLKVRWSTRCTPCPANWSWLWLWQCS